MKLDDAPLKKQRPLKNGSHFTIGGHTFRWESKPTRPSTPTGMFFFLVRQIFLFCAILKASFFWKINGFILSFVNYKTKTIDIILKLCLQKTIAGKSGEQLAHRLKEASFSAPGDIKAKRVYKKFKTAANKNARLTIHP